MDNLQSKLPRGISDFASLEGRIDGGATQQKPNPLQWAPGVGLYIISNDYKHGRPTIMDEHPEFGLLKGRILPTAVGVYQGTAWGISFLVYGFIVIPLASYLVSSWFGR